MAQHYSNPRRARDPHALPDVETFEVRSVAECPRCQEGTAFEVHADEEHNGWYWWACFPGCLPDGAPNGPFRTEADALADARDGCEDEEDD